MRGVVKEAINQHLSGIVAIGGYFKFERAVYKTQYFRFRLLKLLK
jgi:hypothetical protein